MDEQARLTFLAANYDNLRNLRFAPLYALFIADPWIGRIDMFHMSDKTWLTWTGAVIGVYIAWSWLLNSYYKRRYGRMDSRPIEKVPAGFWKNPANALAFFLPLGISLYFMSLLRSEHSRVMFVSLPFFSLVTMTKGLLPTNIELRRSYYFAANGFAALIVLLAMIRQAPGHLFFYTYAESFLGAAMLFLAVADHLLLTQTFHQGPHDAYA